MTARVDQSLASIKIVFGFGSGDGASIIPFWLAMALHTDFLPRRVSFETVSHARSAHVKYSSSAHQCYKDDDYNQIEHECMPEYRQQYGACFFIDPRAEQAHGDER